MEADRDTQATLDGVIDPVGEWVQADGDHGDYSFERQARSSGLALGRKTYEGLAGYWPSQSGKWAGMATRCRSTSGPTPCPAISSGTRPCSRGTSRTSIPKLKAEVDGDLFMHGSGEFAYALAEKGLIDEYEVYLNPLVWGEGNVHVLGAGEPSGWSLTTSSGSTPEWSSSPTSRRPNDAAGNVPTGKGRAFQGLSNSGGPIRPSERRTDCREHAASGAGRRQPRLRLPLLARSDTQCYIRGPLRTADEHLIDVGQTSLAFLEQIG